ncbi:fec operon regulator FecR [compost metagenome]
MSEQERELLIKYNAGKCTEAEKAAVEKWLFELNSTAVNLSGDKIAAIKAEILSQLPGPVAKVRKFSAWLPIAAAVTLFAFGAGWFYFSNLSANKLMNNDKRSAYLNDVAPGRNSATLTLADGKKIVLSDAGSGELVNESGVVISKTAEGEIIYNVASGAGSEKGTERDRPSSGVGNTAYNTLATTNGETFRVRLPDGSLVVLNAASSLTYPTHLNQDQERRVKLYGEAYFEVAKVMVKQKGPGSKESVIRKPFIVSTDKQQVEVLGTHFNINSYADELNTKTTLLEGSVKVASLDAGRHSSILKPGQQAVSRAEMFLITEVNIAQAVAWKNGTFDFDNEDIQSVMRKISRWYNVEVEFEGSVSKERFNGALSRQKNISQMLKMLESTGVVHFKIEGRRVIVINN